MANCPKCNHHLRLADWKQKCPYCGANIVLYDLQERLIRLGYLDLDETEKQRLTRIFGGSPLLPSFRKIELWEKMFDDLDSIVDDKGGAGEQVQ